MVEHERRPVRWIETWQAPVNGPVRIESERAVDQCINCAIRATTRETWLSTFLEYAIDEGRNDLGWGNRQHHPATSRMGSDWHALDIPNFRVLFSAQSSTHGN
jgi:hypothetical protein